MNVKILLNQQVRNHLNIQRGLLVLMFFLFSALGAQAQTVTSDKDDYAPGEVAIISGTGWAGDTHIDVHFEETPAHHAEHQHDYHDIAVDANGNWTIKYQIEERHFGVAFDVHVVGKQSDSEAYTHFTDAVSLTNISPNSGSTGTEVTISGEGLFVNNWNTRIKFGTIEATEKAGTRKTSKPQSVVVYAPAQLLSTGEYKVTAEVYRNNPGTGILQTETSPQDFFFRYGKLSQTITFAEVADKTFGGAAFAIAPSASSGLAVAITTGGGISYDAATGMVSITAAGPASITAAQAGNSNYEAATSVTRSFTIGKSTATLTLGNLEHVYDGTVKSATATTSPAGLSGVTVSGSGTNFGDYAAAASLDNANYTATAVNGTLSISKASSTVTMSDVTATYNASAHAASATATGAGGMNITEGINYSYAGTGSTTYTASAAAPINAGTYSVTATYEGGANHSGSSATATVTINKAPATLTLGNLKHMFDGSPKQATATTSPVGLSGVSVTYIGSPNLPTAAGAYAVVAALNNSNYAAANATATLNIYNAPVVTLNVSEPVQVNGSSVVTATQEGDVFEKSWRVVSPNGSVALYPVNGSSYTITSSIVGVYTVTMTYKNGIGVDGTSDRVFAVFYNPSAGFVTGGGWINSPEGASTAFPEAVGKANFGFVSKYEKGATKPTGNTEFQFKGGDLNFKSTNYQWLTVAGARAQYKGTGTINGVGSYDFILTAIDGQVSGGNGMDRLRIKITNGNETIYDNQAGSDEAELDPLSTQVTGSIVIHTPNVKSTSTKAVIAAGATVPETLETTKFQNYPNPYNNRTTITFSSVKEESFALEVYDVKGALVRKVDMGVTEAGKTYSYELESRNMPEGMYFARLITSSGIQNIKMVLKK